MGKVEQQIPFDFEAAARRRDRGMKRTADHANDWYPGWVSEAVTFIRRYAEQHQEFLAEHARGWALLHGCPKPPNAKAWGPAMKQAEREGVVAHNGAGRAASSNLSFKVKWRSLVYGGTR